MKNIVSEVCILNNNQFDQWNNFVDSSPQGDIFCYSWWLEVITKGNYKIIAIFEKGEIVAGIPLAYNNGLVIEPPLTRTLGPIFKNLNKITERKEILKKREWLEILLDQISIEEVFQFCTSHNFNDWLPFRWRGYKQTTRYTYLINYENKSELDLWSALNNGKKNHIKNAYKNNISVKLTNDLADFYQLIELTYQRQSLEFSFSFNDFKKLDDAILKRDMRRIITAYDENGKPHAAIYVIFNQKSAYSLLSGGDPELRNLGGHTLVLWEAIKYFRDKTLCYNFGGSDIRRIERHINEFGGILTQYFHIFSENNTYKEIEKIKEIEVTKEINILQPHPDDISYHLKTIAFHCGIIFKHKFSFIKGKVFNRIKVSVISPCYNHGQYINEMLDSIFKQTFQNFEIIIVNDGSTDNTAEILNRIHHPKIKIIHTENFGPAHARNLAISFAKGELIINLDADDTIAPEFISKCVAIMDNNPNYGIVYSNAEYFGYKYGTFNLPDYTLINMLNYNCIIANACFRKSDWKLIEGYSNCLHYGLEDYDLWLSIIGLGRDVYQIKESLVYYRTYAEPELCRSGRRNSNQNNHQEMILRIFYRHIQLYKKFPEKFEELRHLESQLKHEFNNKRYDFNNPVFSIITPTKKRPELLKRNILSVINQSFTNYEHIIVDDANDPETKKIISSFNSPRIRYCTHQIPKGAAAAYNTGIKNARGQFINFLDDDDEYLPEILEKIFVSFRDSTNCSDFIWTGVIRIDDYENQEKIISEQIWNSDFESKEQGLSVSTAIGNGFGLSVRKECIDRIGLYDESLFVGEDTDFLIRLSSFYNFQTVPEILVRIHLHNCNQLTDRNNLLLRLESYERILYKNYDFLSKHFLAFNTHISNFSKLSYNANRKKEGRKALIMLIKKYPKYIIGWLDLFCLELCGKNYNSSKLKILNNIIKKYFSILTNLLLHIRHYYSKFKLSVIMPINIRRIKKSGLFDIDYYLKKYTDVKISGLNPIKHYILFGGFEGRNPSNYFNTSKYLDLYKDVKTSGMNPLLHFILHGQKEGRIIN